MEIMAIKIRHHKKLWVKTIFFYILVIRCWMRKKQEDIKNQGVFNILISSKHNTYLSYRKDVVAEAIPDVPSLQPISSS